MEKKWSDGKPYERSRRLKHIQEMENKDFSKNIENAAYNTSLNHDENTWDLLNPNFNENINTNEFKEVNKREELDSKISGRELIQQIGNNPFLNNNNYVNDISNRDKFLIPQNTNQDIQ